MSRKPGNVVPIRPDDDEPSVLELEKQLEVLEASQADLESESQGHQRSLTALGQELSTIRKKLGELKKTKSGDIVRRTRDILRSVPPLDSDS